MEDNRQHYILGYPIETKIGQLHFIKLKEYPRFLKLVNCLLMTKNKLVDYIREKDSGIADFISKHEYIVILEKLKDIYPFYYGIKDIFTLCFKEDVFDKIKSDEEFNYYKKLILEMNCIFYEEPSPNPEIEYFNQLKKVYRKNSGHGEISFESMYVNVAKHYHESMDEITVYKLYAYFYGIARDYKYKESVLYRTVSNDIKVESWFKDINMRGEDKETTLSEFIDNIGKYNK